VNFAANLGYLFTEHDFLDRFAAAAACGFSAVEFAAPYAYAPSELARRLRDNALQCVLFNLPMGAPGSFGLGCRPERGGEFREGVGRALDYASALGTRRINCIAGVLRQGDDPEHCEATLVENLRFAAGELAAKGIELVIEPINSRDVPGFLVPTCDRAAEVIARCGVPNLYLQCDLYHAAMMDEDPSSILSRHRAIVRHIQFADAPGRGEPGTGQVDFARHFATIEAIGYEGWVSAEYRPTRATAETLHWFRHGA